MREHGGPGPVPPDLLLQGEVGRPISLVNLSSCQALQPLLRTAAGVGAAPSQQLSHPGPTPVVIPNTYFSTLLYFITMRTKYNSIQMVYPQMVYKQDLVKNDYTLKFDFYYLSLLSELSLWFT